MQEVIMKKIVFVGVLWLTGLCSFPAMAVEPVKIGTIFAKTGIAAVQNASYIEMVELAVEELNNQGGVLGRPVELIVLDNKSTPIGSTLAAKEAVKLQVTAVIGSGLSSHSLAAAPILQQEGIPMVTPVSTNPKVTHIGNYIFRVCFIDSFQGAAMAKFAYADLGARTAVVLRNIDEAYSTTLAEYFINAFKRIGGKVLLDGGYREKRSISPTCSKRRQSLDPTRFMFRDTRGTAV